jgi:hypothetical protein
VAACSDGNEDLFDDGLLPDDAPAESGFELLEIGDKGGGGCGVGHDRKMTI